MTSIGKLGACAALTLGLAAPALAGPQMTFGPKDEGVLQIDYKGQLQLTMRDTGSGATGEDRTSNINFRRNRLALMGSWGENFGLYVQTEYVEPPSITPLGINSAPGDPQFNFLDAVFRFTVNDGFNVNAGKFKHSFARENLEACEMPLTLDRSLFITTPLLGTNPTRDIGASVWGNLFSDMFQYRVEIMDGRKAGAGSSGMAAAPKSSFRLGARAHVSLLDPESDYGYKGTYQGQKKVLTLGAAVQLEPDAVYGDWKARTGAKDYSAWTVDAFFEYPLKDAGTLTASAAYFKFDLDHAYLGANPDPGSQGQTGERNGWYAKAGYMLPNTPWQVFARTEKWRFAQLSGFYNQQLTWNGIGANYYIRGQNLKLTLEYNTTRFDQLGTVGGVRTQDLKTFVTQLQVIF